MRFIYTVWLRDTTLQPDDQDFEWPACIMIEAPSGALATEWGDHLARRYVASNPSQVFLRSFSEEAASSEDVRPTTLPLVEYGYEASDEEIGW